METLNLIYYSPTGTTKKIVKEISKGFETKQITEYSLTATSSQDALEFNDKSITIIGLPCYGGRLPLPAIETLKTFKANAAPAILVIVYGNRAFEDSLLELNDIVSSNGFIVIGAAAFIAEHSYSTTDKPIAHGRPDELDLIKCHDFSNMIQHKLNDLIKNPEKTAPEIPGHYPYKERVPKTVLISPETDSTKCNLCGSCVDICPSNAISINETVNTDKNLCTWCCACLKNCPNDARTFDEPAIDALKDRLFSMCSERKEPEFFV